MFYCNLKSIIIMNIWVSWDLRKSAITMIDRQLDRMIFIFVLPSIYVVLGVWFLSRFSGIAPAFAGQTSRDHYTVQYISWWAICIGWVPSPRRSTLYLLLIPPPLKFINVWRGLIGMTRLDRYDEYDWLRPMPAFWSLIGSRSAFVLEMCSLWI